MTAAVDFSDLPLVAPEKLAVPMRFLIDSGRGLALLRGLSHAELREIDHAVWLAFGDDPAGRLALVLRFRAFAEVFTCSRLRSLFLKRGLALLAPALKVAAGMRLNMERGFNPHKFAVALEGLLSELDRARVPDRYGQAEMLEAAIA
ncbi:MAG: hypothetical protein F9K29_01805 [Hyphomicrobiaceae bacterium]|nr:MAG: hypothetical protein F9K29_01805 [Hyphomicrobiaceae bacterium]